jgi:hypothetical protein
MSHGREHANYARHFPTRRQLLQIGGLGCLGLNLASLLKMEAAQAGSSSSRRVAKQIKSCIVLFCYGGPSHLDTWDMKPNAPAEVRGTFRPIATSVPGIRVCEHLPRSARVAHHLAIVRSMHHPMRNHNSAAVEALCGRTPLKGDLELLADDANSFPCYGSALSYLKPGRPEIPAHVALPHVMYNVVTLPGQTAGFLGAANNPFQVNRDPNERDFHIGELEVPADLSLARLEERHSLLARIDAQIMSAERLARNKAMTVYQEKAFELLRSPAVRHAFDLSQEPAQVRERYGRHTLGQSLLLARRLVEGGVRLINVNDKVHNGQLANWDSHENNFSRLKDDLLPPADQAFAALVEDLDARGLLESTLVIALAEFGRTPKINKTAGRDHWPDCFSIVLAGGGIRGGTVYGASDKLGAFPATDAMTPGDLAATLFWRFGLDPTTEIRDLTGRPYRLADGEPIRGLFA